MYIHESLVVSHFAPKRLHKKEKNHLGTDEAVIFALVYCCTPPVLCKPNIHIHVQLVSL